MKRQFIPLFLLSALSLNSFAMSDAEQKKRFDEMRNAAIELIATKIIAIKRFKHPDVDSRLAMILLNPSGQISDAPLKASLISAGLVDANGCLIDSYAMAQALEMVAKQQLKSLETELQNETSMTTGYRVTEVAIKVYGDFFSKIQAKMPSKPLASILLQKLLNPNQFNFDPDLKKELKDALIIGENGDFVSCRNVGAAICHWNPASVQPRTPRESPTRSINNLFGPIKK